MRMPSATPTPMLIDRPGWNARVSAAAHATAATNSARVTRCQGMGMTPGMKTPSSYPRPCNRADLKVCATCAALPRPASLRQAGLDLQRVLVIELLENPVGESHAVQLPERVIAAVVVEVLVVGL